MQSILLEVRISLWMTHISDSVSCSGTKIYTRTFATIWSRFMNTSTLLWVYFTPSTQDTWPVNGVTLTTPTCQWAFNFFHFSIDHYTFYEDMWKSRYIFVCMNNQWTTFSLIKRLRCYVKSPTRAQYNGRPSAIFWACATDDQLHVAPACQNGWSKMYNY